MLRKVGRPSRTKRGAGSGGQMTSRVDASAQPFGETMTNRSIDEIGQVDLLVGEFPPDSSTFTGEGAMELLRLHDAGIIRVMDIVIVAKADDGTVMAQELGDLGEMDELSRLETELAETLAADDIEHFAGPMEPGTVAGILVFENLWAAAFGSAVRRNGGQVVANGRIGVQSLIAAIQADEEMMVGAGA